MVSCLIIDLDGTLVDSMEANVKSYSQAFRDVGLDFNAEKYRHLFGLRYPEIMDELAPAASGDQREEVKRLKAKYYKENLDIVTINDGLLALLKAVKDKLRLALVTTASRTNVDNLLAHLSIDMDLFDVVVVGEDVHRGKPDPECYEVVLGKLNESAQNCVVFEDSQSGIEAAGRADIRVIRVAV